MRAANYVEMTTTSIAGTLGDGAVTCTQITSVPTFTITLGSAACAIRYAIEDTVNKKFETGIGSVAANVLTRTRPQVTWDGTTYDDSAPAALQFGATPTSGNVKIRLSAVAESQGVNIPGVQSLITTDATWRDYPINNAAGWRNNGASATFTADREYYSGYKLERAGSLSGIQVVVNIAVASSNLKLALYSVGHDGLPAAKIVDFNVIDTSTTGTKTDTATGTWSPAGPIWLTPGWYIIGYISSHAISLNGTTDENALLKGTLFGRMDGYGYSNCLYKAGSYTTGLPSVPDLTGGTALNGNSFFANVWIGLKVTS